MEEQKKENKFTKEQWLASKQFTEYRDLLKALLENKKSYEKSEINKILQDFFEKEVK